MSYRRLASMSALAMIVAVVSVSVAGQEGPPKPSKMPAAVAIDKAKVIPKNYTVPKTAWGEPDLQGVWSYATTTPLQRPDALAGKETLTQTEISMMPEELLAPWSDREVRDLIAYLRSAAQVELPSEPAKQGGK